MLDQPLGALGCWTIESSFCRTTLVVVPVPFGRLWDFLVHPQASDSISSWVVPVLQTKDSSSMEKLLAGRKKITVKHQGGNNAELQCGGARGQSHDEKWPGTNAFGLKKINFLTRSMVGNAPSCWEAFQLAPLLRAAYFYKVQRASHNVLPCGYVYD